MNAYSDSTDYPVTTILVGIDRTVCRRGKNSSRIVILCFVNCCDACPIRTATKGGVVLLLVVDCSCTVATTVPRTQIKLKGSVSVG